jgi:hypothetical protein
MFPARQVGTVLLGRAYFCPREDRVMPMNPVVRPPIEQPTATKFSNRVDSMNPMTIRKGKRMPMMSRPKAMAMSFRGLSISPLYL